MSSINENISSIKKDIVDVCKASGREPRDITIVTVTKTIDLDSINKALECGLNTCGENKVQELIDKYEQLDKSIKWHMIGHLQTNKVKYIIDKVELIHSLDSIRLAKEIDKRAKNIDKIMDVLVQVNIGEEDSKYGININSIEDFLVQLKDLKNLRVQGLMAIAPYVEDPEEVRSLFRQMKNEYDELKSIKAQNINMNYLSMGMTNDYKVAIEEGSNLIRIGTGIFGNRNYH